jgi:hypothetical protein
MKETSTNREKGNTLSLIVTCALFIVVIGLGIDFLLMIFKGQRRLTNTSDAVALELARNILRTPKIMLNEGYEMDTWGPLSDNGWIDLYRYNKIVAQTVLTAANAAADGSDAAIDAANEMIEHLQGVGPVGHSDKGGGGSLSLGARLKLEIDKAARDFSTGGNANINNISMGPGNRPVSLLPEAFAGGDDDGNYGHVGAPGTKGDKGGARGGSAGAGSHGSHAAGGSHGSHGSNDTRGGSNGGWTRGESWSKKFPKGFAPGSIKYQPWIAGTPSSEKAAVISSQAFASYVSQEGASNIAINPLSLPIVTSTPVGYPTTVVSIEGLINKNGKSYVPGYKGTKYKNGGSKATKLREIVAVPMQVGDQPHLISTRVFDDSKNLKPKFLGSSIVPANAYKFVTSTIDVQGHNNIMISTAEVASGITDYIASYDRGYIEIINSGDRASYPYNGTGTITDNVYSKELMTGIHLADNGAFTTDPRAIGEWARFNAGTGPQPALLDSNGNTRVFGNTATIRGAAPPSGGTRANGPCMWVHVSHGATGNPDLYDDTCGRRLPDFQAAFPQGPIRNVASASYTAVEQFKHSVRKAFPSCEAIGCPNESTGLRIPTDGWKGNADDHDANDGRYWRDARNPVPADANSKISRPGTVLEMLTLIDPVKTESVLALLKNKMYQIQPTADDNQIMTLLRSKTFELGEVAYIYLDPEKKKLVFNNSKPRSMAGEASNISDIKRKPKGHVRVVSSQPYATIGHSVNPLNEGGFHFEPYTSMPDPQSVGTGVDSVEESNGVGTYNNMLRLKFSNKCGGTGTNAAGVALTSIGDFCQPD